MNMLNELKSCKIVTSDQEKADIFNEHFSTNGQKLADRLPDAKYENSSIFINRVTPTVMDINITYESRSQGLLNLKPDKACGPNKVSPKLLMSAGQALIPSLLCTFSLLSPQVPKATAYPTNGKMPMYRPCTGKTMKLKRVTTEPYLSFVCLVVGVVFVGFRKAFDISSRSAKKTTTTRVTCIRQFIVVDRSLKSPSSNSDQWLYIEVMAC